MPPSQPLLPLYHPIHSDGQHRHQRKPSWIETIVQACNDAVESILPSPDGKKIPVLGVENVTCMSNHHSGATADASSATEYERDMGSMTAQASDSDAAHFDSIYHSISEIPTHSPEDASAFEGTSTNNPLPIKRVSGAQGASHPREVLPLPDVGSYPKETRDALEGVDNHDEP